MVGFVLGYLFAGVCSLAIFDVMTGRIRANLEDAILETRAITWGLGRTVATVILLIFAIAFWPAVFFGAVRDLRKPKTETEAEKVDVVKETE